MVKNNKVAEKALEKSSDPQTDSEFVATESLQNLNTQGTFVLQQSKEVARELGTSIVHIVKKKVVEDA